MTDGFFFRLEAAARRHGASQDFRNLAGLLTEEHALTVMREAHPSSELPGAGAVHGEQPYGPRRRRRFTPDIAIDGGTDLVLMEVSYRPLSKDTLLGDDAAAMRDLDWMLGDKIGQLTDRVEDFLAGEATVPGVELEHVRGIWPSSSRRRAC